MLTRLSSNFAKSLTTVSTNSATTSKTPSIPKTAAVNDKSTPKPGFVSLKIGNLSLKIVSPGNACKVLPKIGQIPSSAIQIPSKTIFIPAKITPKPKTVMRPSIIPKTKETPVGIEKISPARNEQSNKPEMPPKTDEIATKTDEIATNPQQTPSNFARKSLFEALMSAKRRQLEADDHPAKRRKIIPNKVIHMSTGEFAETNVKFSIKLEDYSYDVFKNEERPSSFVKIYSLNGINSEFDHLRLDQLLSDTNAKLSPDILDGKLTKQIPIVIIGKMPRPFKKVEEVKLPTLDEISASFPKKIIKKFEVIDGHKRIVDNFISKHNIDKNLVKNLKFSSNFNNIQSSFTISKEKNDELAENPSNPNELIEIKEEKVDVDSSIVIKTIESDDESLEKSTNSSILAKKTRNCTQTSQNFAKMSTCQQTFADFIKKSPKREVITDDEEILDPKPSTSRYFAIFNQSSTKHSSNSTINQEDPSNITQNSSNSNSFDQNSEDFQENSEDMTAELSSTSQKSSENHQKTRKRSIPVETITCESCNRIMKASHHPFHLQTSYHKFFLEFPQFRSDKIQRQQKLTENDLLRKLKIPCDICERKIVAKCFRNHLKSTSHKFYVANPTAERKGKRKPRSKTEDLSNDLLVENLDPRKSKPYICDYCRKKFFKKSSFEQHIKVHVVSSYSIKCSYCSEKFLTQPAMMSHRKAVHTTSDGTYNCDTCNKKYFRHREYLRHCTSKSHMKRLNGDENNAKNAKKSSAKYTCFICNINFSNSDSYKRHCGSYHVDENEFCTRIYKQVTPMTETKCKICSKELSSPNDLQIHYVMDHDNSVSFKIMTKKPISCHCGKILPRNHYKAHMVNFHPESTVCGVCGEDFYSIKSFRYHRDYGHLPFMHCDICGYKKQSKARLRKHMKYHDDFYRFQFSCAICGQGYSSTYYLKKHIRSVHENVKREKTYPCDLCGKKYTTRGRVSEHKTHAHMGVPRKYAFTCDICNGIGFESLKKFQIHEETKGHIKKLNNQLMGELIEEDYGYDDEDDFDFFDGNDYEAMIEQIQ